MYVSQALNLRPPRAASDAPTAEREVPATSGAEYAGAQSDRSGCQMFTDEASSGSNLTLGALV
jgi:hypothetical protein